MSTLSVQLRAAVTVNVPTPIPIAVLNSALLSTLQLVTGTRIIVRYRYRKLAVWVRDLREVPPQTPPSGSPADQTIWLSRRACDLLRVAPGDQITIEVCTRRSLRVAPARADDLPRANEVDVAPEIVAEFGTNVAIAYSKYGSVPIILRRRDMAANVIRMSMLTRSLIGVKPQENVEIGVFQSERLFFADHYSVRRRGPRVARRALAVLDYGVRFLLQVVEAVLKLVMGAPALLTRTVEAEIGDDTNRVVRVAPETLRLLGIQAGDAVYLEWGESRVIAVAHEKLATSKRGDYHGVTADDWGSDPADDAVPDHLVVGIAAEMRNELRIPRRTIINVRRRVTGILLQRVNELTIPIGGLLFAALALEKISVLAAAVGAVIVTVMAMVPVKHRVAPRGRWP